MAQPFLAQIQMVGFNFAPQGWATCDGQLMAISQNTALFSLLGTNYGGNGTSNFGLPNLGGCIPIGKGQGPGLTERVMGETGGSESITLNVVETPAHTHNVTVGCVSTGGDNTSPVGRVWSMDLGVQTGTYSGNANNATMSAGAVTVAPAGSQSALPHSNLQPYLTVLFVIALSGIYPSRS